MTGITDDISIREASFKWGVSEQCVNQFCAETNQREAAAYDHR